MEQQLTDDFELTSKIISEWDVIKARQETFIKVTKAKFNIFTALRKSNDEVYLHSKFLALLLDAKGSHDCDSLFLNLFIQTLIDGSVFNHNNQQINDKLDLEKFLRDDFVRLDRECRNDYGQVDIGLVFKDSMLVIENKIEAHEQDDQIFRYAQYAKSLCKRNYVVLYLTLNGDISSTAGEFTDKYWRISYSKHILEWLELCLEKTYKYPNINNVIKQYKDAVSDLVGKNFLTEMNMQDVKKLIKKCPKLLTYVDEIKSGVDDFRDKHTKIIWELIQSGIKAKGFGEPVDCGKYAQFFETSPSLTGFKGESFKFLVERSENKEDIYCGISLHNIPDSEYYSICEKHKDVFQGLIHEAKARCYTEQTCFIGGVWPIGMSKFLSIDEKWFIDNCLDDSDVKIQISAKNALDKLDKYIQFVTTEWNKAIEAHKDNVPK